MASVTTSSDGSYSISVIAGRTYTISVNAPGFESYSNTYVPLATAFTQNIQLVATNCTVEGVLTYLGAPLSGVPISFTSAGQAAVDSTAITGTNGSYSVQLHPGLYEVGVDENLTLGSNATQYQYSDSLTININNDPLHWTSRQRNVYW